MSDTTEVGRIIAYLQLVRTDWTTGVRATEADADRLGRLSPTIRIQTNTGDILAQLALVQAAERKVGTSADQAKPFVMNLWAALAAVAPAAVPITAVAGGALLGLLPVAATVELAVKGISNQMKAGALQGTAFASEVNAAKGELQQLETTAASGLMSGIDQALQNSKPLWSELNQDIALTSGQLGGIVGHAGPALLSILHQLEPLFATFGSEVERGAAGLDHWAESGTGLSHFVTYVQTELPTVEQLIGNVATLVSHLLQGAAPFGGVLLGDLSMLIHLLNLIPIGVLQEAIPLAVSLYTAFKAYQGINSIVAGVNSAVSSMKAPLVESSAAASASALATEAAVAQEAAAVASAKAAEAAAAAEAAVEIAASAEATSSVLAAGAAASADAAIEFAAAMQSEADAAVAAAATISEQAEAAAAASAGAGEAAAVGWSSMLGPIGAVAVGLGVLTMAFRSNDEAAQQAQQTVNSYTQALEQSKGAIDANVQSKVNQDLVDSKAIQNANALGISTKTLTEAILGGSGAVRSYSDIVSASAYKATPAMHALDLAIQNALTGSSGTAAQHAHDLQMAIDKLAPAFKTAQDNAKQYLDALEQTSGVTNAAAVAAAKLYGLTGTDGVTAYLTAEQAAAKNTQQTQAQTLAFQLENNAAQLVNQALQTMAGQNLNVAQAQTALGQSVQSVISSMKQNGKAVDGNSVAALANQQALEGNVSAARQLMQAVSQQTGSNDKAIASYKASKQALDDELAAHHELTPAIQAVIDKLYDVKGVSAYLAAHPTKIDLQDEATAKLKALQAYLNSVVHGDYEITVGVNYNSTVGRKSGGAGGAGAFASGTGAGGLPEGWAWVGDPGPASELVHKQGAHVDVFSHQQSLAIAQQMGMNVPTFATGTGAKTSGASSLISAVQSLIQAIGQAPPSPQISLSNTTATTVVQQIQAAIAKLNAAIKDGLSAKQADPLRAQILDLAALAQKELGQLKIKVDSSDLTALKASLTGSADQIKTAFGQLVTDVEDLGVPATRLNPLIASANKIADQLGAANEKLANDIAARQAEAQKIAQTIDQFNIATDTGVGTGGVLGDLQKQVDAAANFGADLQMLKSMGLNDTSLQQLAEAGPTDATMQRIQELLASTPEQIQQINSLVAVLAKDAGTVGDQLAGELYDAGISADQGLIKGLQDKESDIYAQVKKIADGIAAELKKDLQIHSPSLVMRGIGQFVGAGLALGMNDTHPLVLSASKSLANLTIPKMHGTAAPSGAHAAASGTLGDVVGLRGEFAALRAEVRENAVQTARLLGDRIDEAQRRAALRAGQRR